MGDRTKHLEEYAGYNDINPSNVGEIVLTASEGRLNSHSELFKAIGIQLEDSKVVVSNKIRHALSELKINNPQSVTIRSLRSAMIEDPSLDLDWRHELETVLRWVEEEN